MIGAAVLVAGARRRSIIDVTHFVAAAVFVAALAAMTDLAATAANQGQPARRRHNRRADRVGRASRDW